MAVWSTALVDTFPDSSFLYISPGGKKVDGKTEPKSLRHFPVKDANGKVDLPHLRNALARIPDSGVPADVKARLKAKAEAMLAAANRTERDGQLTVERAADGTVELRMYGRIGYGLYEPGITAERVAKMLEENPTQTIRIRMNSQGGDAFEGDTIRALLAAAPNRIEMYVDALAASAASVICMAGDHIEMAPSAIMMIHNARTSTSNGTAADHASAQELLEAADAGAADIYAARSKQQDAKFFRELMDKQTWLSAKRAMEIGLADKIGPAGRVSMELVSSEDLPAEVVERLWTAPVPCATESDMSPDLLARLGLGADASEADALAAIDALKKPAATPIDPAAATRAAAAASASPDAILAMHEAACTAAVERFISEGKVLPASRDKALAACGASAQTLRAACEYWEAAPVIVGRSALVQVGHPAPAAPQLTKFQKQLAREAGISETDLLKRLTAERDNGNG